MAKPTVTLIVFALCFLGAFSQSDNATVVDEDNHYNSSTSLNPDVSAGATTSTKVTNEEQQQHATAENEDNNSDRPENPPQHQATSSTFPPLVHNVHPQDNNGSPMESPTPTQESSKPTLAAAIPTKADKPMEDGKSNMLNDAKSTPTVPPSSSNTLALNSLLLLNIVLMWKFCYY